MTAKQLAALCDAWIAERGMSASAFGYECGHDYSLLQNLRKGQQPTQAKIDKVLRFIGASCSPVGEPESLPPAPRSPVAAQVRHEAEVAVARRKRARRTGGLAAGDLSPIEAIQTAMTAEPRDLVVAVTRKHPLLWARCVLQGRATGVTPAAVLYAAIEAGIGMLEAAPPPAGELLER